MATAWRIVSPRYSTEILSGTGAARFPGRWNRPGEQTVYAAGSQSLAMLERLVYMVSPFPEMTIGAITVPNKYLEYLDLQEEEVAGLLANHNASQQTGSDWIAGKISLALAVPSVHIHPSNWTKEPNILINPQHPDFKRARIISQFNFVYDARLEK